MTIFPHGRLAQTAVFFLLLFFTACSADNGAAGITGESFSTTPEMIQAATAGALKPVVPTETARDSARPAGSSAVTVAAETVNSPVVKPTSDEDPVPTLTQVKTVVPSARESSQVDRQHTTAAAPTAVASDSFLDVPSLPTPVLPVEATRKPDAISGPVPLNSIEFAPDTTIPVPVLATVPVLVTTTSRPTTESPAGGADNSQPVHYSDCVTRTGNNATVGIPRDMALAGSLSLEKGDEIAVFSQDGVICAGVAVWTGQNIALTAWGDDVQTEEIDGLVAGDTMQYRIWDVSEAFEYEVTAVTYQTGDGIFVSDSIHLIDSLIAEKS